MSESTIAAHIEIKPGVCGGRPCVAGTRIRVQDIRAWHELQGLTPEDNCLAVSATELGRRLRHCRIITTTARIFSGK